MIDKDARRKTTVTILNLSIDAFVWNDNTFCLSISRHSGKNEMDDEDVQRRSL